MTDNFKVKSIASGVSVIDSGYFSNDFAAIYIIKQNNKVAIIETGTSFSVSNVQKALEKDPPKLFGCSLYNSYSCPS